MKRRKLGKKLRGRLKRRGLERAHRLRMGLRSTATRSRASSSVAALNVNAPEMFVLELPVHRDKLMEMLDTIRRRVLGEQKPVYVNFKPTTLMFPCGTLRFKAEIDRLHRITGDRQLIRCNYPEDVVVEQVLQKVGILSILGKDERQDPETFADNVRYWHSVSGELADGEAVAPIVTQYRGVLAASRNSDLYDGIVEAMINCAQHAYEHPRRDDHFGDLEPECRNWWMFSQEKDGKLTVALCDLGIGIPASLAETTNWPREFIESALRAARMLSHRDARLIKTAVELHKTRTREEHRGKGFSEILDVVRKTGVGYLKIMSERGVYSYKATAPTNSLNDHRSSIKGTLVQWTIPLPEKRNECKES